MLKHAPTVVSEQQTTNITIVIIPLLLITTSASTTIIPILQIQTLRLRGSEQLLQDTAPRTEAHVPSHGLTLELKVLMWLYYLLPGNPSSQPRT